MRYHSEEEDRLFKMYEPYLKVDSQGVFFLPDDAPQEAKEAQKKVQEILFERKKEEWEFF